MSIWILKEVQNFHEVLKKFFPDVPCKDLNQSMFDLVLALAVIRVVASFLQQGGFDTIRNIFPLSAQVKVSKTLSKVCVNSIFFCFHNCFKDLIITFLIDCLCETYWMITVLKISKKILFNTCFRVSQQ